MKPALKIVISASRRTDIPAFYMPWFMACIEKGVFEVQNPYNRRISKISAGPDRVHTIVFWSKNFGSFIEKGYGEALVKLGYHLFFNFTVNSDDRFIEPNVPPLERRLVQIETLCRTFGPDSVQWRFDPICFYNLPNGDNQNNLRDFKTIADIAGGLGIKRCITSFMDLYPKIQKRAGRTGNVTFTTPSLAIQKTILLRIQNYLAPNNIALFTCCEAALLESLPPDAGIKPSACVPNDLLKRLFGGTISLRKDPGQRLAAGCDCNLSTDIGSYQYHPCYHDCGYCYANPSSGCRGPES